MTDEPLPGLKAFVQWAKQQKPTMVVEWATSPEDWEKMRVWVVAGFGDGDIMRDLLKLSTGHELYAHQGIIGLSPDLEVFGGYDQSIQVCDDGPEALRSNEVGPAECVALADVMIARWQAFRALHTK